MVVASEKVWEEVTKVIIVDTKDKLELLDKKILVL